ncbi:MAG: UDP-N-acetylmuramate--L-alanine ligase [Chlamydiales bacterium]
MAETYHFIGIGGIGMSALARILLQRGHKVSGSDQAHSLLLESLKDEGAEIVVGHAAGTIDQKKNVIYNSQVAKDNPEYLQAQKLECPILHRSDLLAMLLEGSKPLLVAGTHGKTTTSSLLAHVLSEAGLFPSLAIGGIVRSLGTNGKHGKGTYFVAEADESDGTFLKYRGFGGIITNIDNDHLDHWLTEQKLEEGFLKFAQNIRSSAHCFICIDDERVRRAKIPGTTYGFQQGADLRITHFHQEGWHLVFNVRFESKEYREIILPLIGQHNALNGAAVFGLALRLGVSEQEIRSALKSFQGVGRRAEKKGEHRHILLYDDYAHHPTEILATLRGLKAAAGERRLVVAFQPHRYSRTKECMDLFPEVFGEADELILTDIYAAGEAPIDGVTTEVLLRKLRVKYPLHLHYFPRRGLATDIVPLLKKGDLLVTMGAGDITKIGPEILDLLIKKDASK